MLLCSVDWDRCYCFGSSSLSVLTHMRRRVLRHMTDSQAPGALLRRFVLLWLNSKFNNHHHHHDQDRWVLGRPLQTLYVLCGDLRTLISFTFPFSASVFTSLLFFTALFSTRRPISTLKRQDELSTIVDSLDDFFICSRHVQFSYSHFVRTKIIYIIFLRTLLSSV